MKKAVIVGRRWQFFAQKEKLILEKRGNKNGICYIGKDWFKGF